MSPFHSSKAEAFRIGRELAKNITDMQPSCIELKFEKVLSIILIEYTDDTTL